MTITFKELCELLAREKSVQADFWKHDPLYIVLGNPMDRQKGDTTPFAVIGGPDLFVDEDQEGNAVGIEFAI